MPYNELKDRVYRANIALVDSGLVKLTWGNSSGADRAAGVMAIKPSGVPYARLTADDIVVLNIASGEVFIGEALKQRLKPLSRILLLRLYFG